MSGGRWGYLGAQLRHAALELEAEIEDGGRSLAVTGKLAEAAVCLRRAAVYEERCDWLLSGDDGPDTFLHGLAKQLREVGGDEWWSLYRDVERLRSELDDAQALALRYRVAIETHWRTTRGGTEQDKLLWGWIDA